MKICILTSGLNLYGRIYASKLIKFNPILVNEEGTQTADELSVWLNSTYKKEVKATYTTNDILSKEVRNIISECDYVINGGVGKILKNDYLKLPKKYFLNAHPGLLPEFRGLDPVCWSLKYDKPLGSTLHVMSEKVDAGPILIRREIPIRYADSITSLRIQLIEFNAQIISDYLTNPSIYIPYDQNLKNKGYYSSFPNSNNTEIEMKLKIRNQKIIA